MWVWTAISGGPVGRAVRMHIRAGLKVYATREAALTLHANLEMVSEMCFSLVKMFIKKIQLEDTHD